MNCSDATRLIHLERDGPLKTDERRAMEAHVGTCEDCREVRAALAQAAEVWREETESADTPDPASEWLRIKRAIRQADSAARTLRRPKPWWHTAASMAGAACALLVVLAIWRPWQTGPAAMAEGVQVEYVEFAEGATNPMVYVNEDTGFVVVWAEIDGVLAGS